MQRDYEVDFLVKTADATFLVESKGERDLNSPTVQLKVRAAQSWCEAASTVLPPAELKQRQRWEYLIISEKLFQGNRGLSFEALRPFCAGLRDELIARAESRLAVQLSTSEVSARRAFMNSMQSHPCERSKPPQLLDFDWTGHLPCQSAEKCGICDAPSSCL